MVHMTTHLHTYLTETTDIEKTKQLKQK